ncbi:MAG TPA: hypothetical protein PLR38_02415 [Syntrophorhabdaceae bacterium]|nr:hypothetical protein [Syntrophorhabdaceae bacterium]HOL04586.1 hypothetical protein [Syntrophorhabdaceae bacterium]HPP41358.1 hypothetical protein [Syntrophorhabdaceae bacterium]
MEIIFFNPSKSQSGKTLLEILNIHKNSVDTITVIDNLDAFTKRLVTIKEKNTIAVIFAAKEFDLIELYSYKHHLYRVIPILILPNNGREIIALGLRFNPFFIISNYNDLKKISRIISVISMGNNINEGTDSPREYKDAA